MGGAGDFVTVIGDAPNINDRSATMTDMVNTRFDRAEAYAEENVQLAQAQVKTLSNLLASLETPENELDTIVMPELAGIDYNNKPTPPDEIDVSEISETAPTTPSFANIPAVTSNIPAGDINFSLQYFDAPIMANISVPTDEPTLITVDVPSAPDLSIPTAPVFVSVSTPSVPSLEIIPEVVENIPSENLDFVSREITVPTPSNITVPVDDVNIESIPIPDKPDLSLPTPPTFDEIERISPPSISLPEFDIDAPIMDVLNEPSPFAYSESAYNSDLWPDLLTKVIDGIRNGGTGLDADVEEELYNRALERQRVENERLYRETENSFSATGFPLPTGAMASRLAEVGMEISRKNDQMSREILINQAELAQKNTQFVIEKGIQMDAMAREFFNAMSNRSLDAAKAIAQNSVDVFRAVLEKYNLHLERYKAEAAVFAQRIQAAMYEVEIYKAQIEGLNADAKLQAVRAEIYRTQVDAINAAAGIYKTEMESAKVRSEIELSKLAIFKARVEAYIAQLEGEKNRYIIYSTEVEAEKGRAEAFGEMVKAYAMRVEAAKTKADVQTANAELVLKENQQLIDMYRAQLEEASMKMQAQTVQAGLYETQMKAVAIGAEVYKTEVDAAKVKSDIELSKLEIFKARVAAYAASLEGEKVKAGIYTARLEGERIRTQAYAEMVRAYATRVDAAKSAAEVSAINAENIFKGNQLLLEAFKAEVAGWGTGVDAQVKIVGAQTQVYDSQIKAYAVGIDAVKTENETKIRELEMQIKEAELQANIAVSNAKLVTDGYVALKNLQAEGYKGIMNAMAQLAASSMNAVNASATVGASFSGGESVSANLNATISETHHFEEEPS